MTDQELMDKLASEYSPPLHPAWAGEVNEAFKAGFDSREAQVDELRAELEAWNKIAVYAGRTRQEIYAMAGKLKRGEYKTPVPDLPTCSMAPASVKVHDTVCDLLEARAYNEDDVCTASVGIWAAIALCEKLFSNERDQLKAMAEQLAQALELAQSNMFVTAPGVIRDCFESALAEYRAMIGEKK